MSVTHAEVPDLLTGAVSALVAINPNPFFVQVGGFDGVSFDPLRSLIVDKNLSGLIVEPIPQYFEKLKSLYTHAPNISAINCAITEEDGERTIWRFNPEAVERGLLPPHFAGISSFLMEDLLKETGVLGRSSPNAETTAALRKLVQAVPVQCRTMDSLLREHSVAQVDILQIDTEGYDYNVLKLFDFARFKPGVVHYEHQHLNQADRAAAEALLRGHGYHIQRNVFDTLAVTDKVSRAMGNSTLALRRLAVSLHTEGRAGDARLLLEHLNAAYPSDTQTLRELAKVLAGEGKILDALAKLAQLKSISEDAETMVDDIRRHMTPAIDRFNAHIAAGEIAEAEKYAAALAGLAPGSVALLNSALACNVALGRTGEAEKFAAAILKLDASHEAALAAVGKSTGDAEAVIEQRVAAVLGNADGAQALLRLRDMHDVASAILCRPLTERGIAQVEQLTQAASDLAINVEKGSDLEGWATHYRLAMKALDLPMVLGETPGAFADAAVNFASAAGAPLDWSGVQACAKRLGAKTVFFAAADRKYVDLYARWYIKSILKFADVNCLIVVHVIGGADQLKEVASSLSIADERLVLAGDRFDAGSVTTKCYDTPPKGLIPVPVAHFQSVRFLRLGALLRQLKLPVFVSDIDLLLQRGVQDLLQRNAGDDVVINENTGNTNAGSRLTANLMLVNPTENADQFLRFLRGYLERALAGPSVSRWIDQFGLLMARHHFVRHARNPRIGYFDTTSDINNVMYRSYQNHPFRFLSLYHGFDTSTLEGNPRVHGEVETKAA
jgi:FkbM family methyltransferase